MHIILNIQFVSFSLTHMHPLLLRMHSQLEGIDSESELLQAVGAAGGRYRVPFVVCIGQPNPEAEEQRLAGYSNNATPRFSLEELVSTDTLLTQGVKL